MARLLPEPIGIQLHYLYSSYHFRVNLSAAETEAMAQARRIPYGPRRKHAAWQWGERGPLVVLVHGWGGYAAQLAPLGVKLAELGYRVIAPDLTGHGASPGYRTAWPYFFRDLAELQRSLGEEVHAYIGHSVGGLAMMAARHIAGIHARHFVCICSPSHPYKGAEFLQDRLAPSAQGMARYNTFVARQFGGATWAELEACGCYRGAGRETLLIYDTEDRFVSHLDGDKIQAAWPEVKVEKFPAHGHLRILRRPELLHILRGFLRH